MPVNEVFMENTSCEANLISFYEIKSLIEKVTV